MLTLRYENVDISWQPLSEISYFQPGERITRLLLTG